MKSPEVTIGRQRIEPIRNAKGIATGNSTGTGSAAQRRCLSPLTCQRSPLNRQPGPSNGDGHRPSTAGARPRLTGRLRRIGPRAVVLCMVAFGLIPTVLLAQDTSKAAKKPAAKAADVFDDDSDKKPAEKQPDDPKKPVEAKPGSKASDPTKPIGAGLERDTIGFTQENASAQMLELEERMFRLSEALRTLEPENASRLGLALKFSREELILNQMKDASKLLKDAQLAKAETEVRELLAKLEHLSRPAPGRGPRLPDEARQAPPDARGPRPNGADHQAKSTARLAWSRDRPSISPSRT